MVNHPYKVGEKYLIRTVTMYYVGRLKEVYEHELVLEDCSWVADTGGFSNALKTGIMSEIEPMLGSDVIIGRGALIDATIWHHELPKETK